MAAMAILRRLNLRYAGATLVAGAGHMHKYKLRCMERSGEGDASPFASLGSTVRRARFVTTKPFAGADADADPAGEAS